MAKRVLMVSTVAGTIGQFNMNNIGILQKMGYGVEVAADFADTSVWTREKTDTFKIQMRELGIVYRQIGFSRNPFQIKKHITSYKELMKLVHDRQYSFIHTHTPVASAITRIVAHKARIRVIYTAHGFHFYKGAPLKNWLIYYPIEWMCSFWTDVLITINKEDFERAKKHLHAKRLEYVPGVGIDVAKFAPRKNGREKIRSEFHIGDQFVLLSVDELNENKNHESVIRSISGLPVTYILVGQGESDQHLRDVADESGSNVILTNFRNDVADFYDAADAYIFPSIREGLNVSLMEAMATGLPCLCGRIRGNTDLIDDEKGGYLFEPSNTEEVRNAIEKVMSSVKKKDMGLHNLCKIRSLNLSEVGDKISSNYGGKYEHLIQIFIRQEKRREIGIPLNGKLIISVGELSARKNHKVVVEALQKLDNNYWYVIVGKGDLKTELEDIDNTGRLRLLGYRTDIVDLLHSSDLFVFPSLQEGLPVALMEAMAAGIPCIASRIRGNTDLGIENLFEPYDVNSIVNMIQSIDLDRDYLKTEASRTIKDFSQELVNRKMYDVYDTLSGS